MTSDVNLPEGTHTVEVVMADNHGLLRGKRVPASLWPHIQDAGICLPVSTLVWGARCELRNDSPVYDVATGYPDVNIVPMPGTMRKVPWRSGTVQVLGELLDEHGAPVAIDPRAALKSVLKRYEDRGLTVKLALEFEFYLLDPATLRPRETEVDCYAVNDGLYEQVLEPIRNQLVDYGIPVEGSNTEYAPGQFEVNLCYQDALEAVDNGVRFRSAVKEIASRHGYVATFMAKPFDGLSGSGMHVHQSVWAGGENVLRDDNARYGLSKVGLHYVAGLAANIGELSLLGSATPNAMKRRRDYSFCPTTDAWGLDNRTVAIRAVIAGANTRIEQRDGSADCNPYLAVAGQLAAGLAGIEGELEPPSPCEGDAYLLDAHRRLPTSVLDAIDLLRSNKVLAESFEPDLVDIIVDTCRFEHTTVTSAVSDVERARYIGVF